MEAFCCTLNSNFEDLEVYFSTLRDYFGDPGIRGDISCDAGGAQIWILLVWDGVWDFGNHFWNNLAFML